jgi:hypothetical protein
MGAGRSFSFAHVGFHLGVEMGVGAHRAGELADAHRFAGRFQTGQGAPELVVHQGHLEAEGDGFRVDAVGAADHGGELVFAGLRGHRLAQQLHVRDQQVGRLHHLHGQRGVDDVGAGQALVDVAGGGAHVFGHVGQEGDDVVVDLALDLVDALDLEFGALLDAFEVGGRHLAQPVQGLAGQHFDLQPDAEFVFVRPDGRHGGPGITRYHCAASQGKGERSRSGARRGMGKTGFPAGAN